MYSAFSISYLSNSIKKDYIPIIFSLCALMGSFLAGGKVFNTINTALIPSHMFNFTYTSIIFFSTSISLLIANLFKLPQSASQTTIFSIWGVGTYLNLAKSNKLLFEIIPTWFLSPLIGFLLCYLTSKYILNFLKLKYKPQYDYFLKSSFLKKLLIIISSYVAFSIGSNNIANSSAPLVALILNEISSPVYSLKGDLIVNLVYLLMSSCFCIGSYIFGMRLIINTKNNIQSVDLIESSIISIVSGSLLLSASLIKGIPTSLIQLNIFSLMGISLGKNKAGPISKNNFINKLFFTWAITPLVAFIISYFLCILV